MPRPSGQCRVGAKDHQGVMSPPSGTPARGEPAHMRHRRLGRSPPGWSRASQSSRRRASAEPNSAATSYQVRAVAGSASALQFDRRIKHPSYVSPSDSAARALPASAAHRSARRAAEILCAASKTLGDPEKHHGLLTCGSRVCEQSRAAGPPILCHYLGGFDHEADADPR
jgi:hypothetical protein